MAVYDHETDEIIPLFNPRTLMWDDHFELVGEYINPATIIGRITIEHLKMNHADQLAARHNLIEASLW